MKELEQIWVSYPVQMLFIDQSLYVHFYRNVNVGKYKNMYTMVAIPRLRRRIFRNTAV